MFLIIFFSDFLFDFLDFHVRRKKNLNLVISLRDKTKSIYATVISPEEV